MNESERMSTQPVAPAKPVQAKQTITKNDPAEFVSIVRTDACLTPARLAFVTSAHAGAGQGLSMLDRRPGGDLCTTGAARGGFDRRAWESGAGGLVSGIPPLFFGQTVPAMSTPGPLLMTGYRLGYPGLTRTADYKKSFSDFSGSA